MVDKIRKIRRCDLPALLEVRNTPFLYEEYFCEDRKGIASFLAYVRPGKMVGFARLKHPHVDQPNKLRPRISDVCIHPDHRREGLGSSIIRELEKIAAKEGHSVAYISVDPVDNERALELYTRLGYEPLHCKPHRACMVLHDPNGGPPSTKEYWKLDLVKSLEGYDPSERDHEPAAANDE